MQASKSIYGLKQTSWSWNLQFDEVIQQFEYVKVKKNLPLQEGKWEHTDISGFNMWMIYYLSEIIFLCLNQLRYH